MEGLGTIARRRCKGSDGLNEGIELMDARKTAPWDWNPVCWSREDDGLLRCDNDLLNVAPRHLGARTKGLHNEGPLRHLQGIRPQKLSALCVEAARYA